MALTRVNTKGLPTDRYSTDSYIGDAPSRSLFPPRAGEQTEVKTRTPIPYLVTEALDPRWPWYAYLHVKHLGLTATPFGPQHRAATWVGHATSRGRYEPRRDRLGFSYTRATCSMPLGHF